MPAARNILALGGGGFLMEPANPLLDDYALSLTGKKRPRICFLATAFGDDPNMIERFYRAFPPARAVASHLALFRMENRRDAIDAQLLEQDVIYVSGGNTANMLAVWRLHGVDRTLRTAWRRGVVLAGVSAGMICWFQDGVTDSFGRPLGPLGDGLGLLKGSACPHYDGEADRRDIYHRLVRAGMATGYAADDGAALHFSGTRLRVVVTSRPNARAYRVQQVRGRVVEQVLTSTYLG